MSSLFTQSFKKTPVSLNPNILTPTKQLNPSKTRFLGDLRDGVYKSLHNAKAVLATRKAAKAASKATKTASKAAQATTLPVAQATTLPVAAIITGSQTSKVSRGAARKAAQAQAAQAAATVPAATVPFAASKASAIKQQAAQAAQAQAAQAKAAHVARAATLPAAIVPAATSRAARKAARREAAQAQAQAAQAATVPAAATVPVATVPFTAPKAAQAATLPAATLPAAIVPAATRKVPRTFEDYARMTGTTDKKGLRKLRSHYSWAAEKNRRAGLTDNSPAMQAFLRQYGNKNFTPVPLAQVPIDFEYYARILTPEQLRRKYPLKQLRGIYKIYRGVHKTNKQHGIKSDPELLAFLHQYRRPNFTTPVSVADPLKSLTSGGYKKTRKNNNKKTTKHNIRSRKYIK